MVAVGSKPATELRKRTSLGGNSPDRGRAGAHNGGPCTGSKAYRTTGERRESVSRTRKEEEGGRGRAVSLSHNGLSGLSFGGGHCDRFRDSPFIASFHRNFGDSIPTAARKAKGLRDRFRRSLPDS